MIASPVLNPMETFADPLIGLNVLLVDDDPIQLRLANAHLIDAGFEVTTATCASEAVDAARLARPDIIVSDVIMDELDGFALCGVLRSEPGLEGIPILLVTSHVNSIDDQKMALATGANGLVQRSHDFDAEFEAMKGILTGPARAAWADQQEPYVGRLATQMAQLLARSRNAEERYRTLFDDASDAISVLTPDGIVLETNRRWEDVLHIPRERIVGRHIGDFAAPEHMENNLTQYRTMVGQGQGRLPAIPIVGPDGGTMYMEFSNKVVSISGQKAVLAIGRDVTESVEARRQLAASEERYRTLVEGIPDVVWSANLDGQVLYMSSRVEGVCGYTLDEIQNGGAGFWLGRVHPEHLAAVRDAWADVSSGSYEAEYRWQHRSGHWIWIRAHASLRTTDEGTRVAEGTFADVTSQKRLEDQLRVSQKMEAVGQLTGGIAHDFNNMLGVVLGNAEFLLEDLPLDDPRRTDVESILDAGQRAAALTRQLLTFSRHQIVEQTDIHPSRIVRDVEKMLHRVIGEDVELTTVLAEDTGTVRSDVGQLEQVIVNLAVNARDAMPQGGKLSIETSNVVVDEALGVGHAVMTPGEYVMIAVSDTGCGMDEQTRLRMFEPFFTTKPVGKGTGLGLSTCYGIVKQSNGYISVYSEVDRGTTFKIYLPRTSAATARPSATKSGSLSSYVGGETILLIEDNAQLRSVIQRTLKSIGYQVLEASNGDEALALHAAHGGCINLVLTDIVMPGAAGPEIVSQIQKRNGWPRVLYMSGYTEHAALRDRRLDVALNFVQKPFSPTTIARKVRAVLDAEEGQ